MDLNQPTLIQFESARKQLNHIPPQGSNSFYNIGTGQINLLTKRSDPENTRFELFTNKGQIYTGAGNFTIDGDIHNSMTPYENLTVITGTTLSVNHSLTVSRGRIEVHGNLELMRNSQLVIKNGAQVTIYIDGTFDIKDKVTIFVEKGSSLTIYGEINIHLSLVDVLMAYEGVVIDSAAVMNVDGIEDLGERPYSLSDYDKDLRDKVINVETQGEINMQDGRLGYTWVDGDPIEKSQLIDISVLWGEAVLGDFKFSVLGRPDHLIQNLQIVRNINVCKGCTLYITEEYKEKRYIRPDLYLGIIISNNTTPANCSIDGKVIVDGENSSITVDRGSTIRINRGGEIWLNHGAVIRSTHNDPKDETFFIDGTLYIEDISQIATFEHDNIVIGETGKIIVFNPDTGEKRLLWTTPNGIEKTDLYRLFKDRIDHVEYHISNNTGIGVDENFEFYGRQFVQWYGGRRIEKAILDGIIVWHDGGFIELYQKVTPWVNSQCTLYHAARLFKSTGSFDNEKLQELVDHLKYVGSGNIVFRFVDGEEVGEVLLNLEDIHMKNVLNHPLTDMYVLTTDNDGQLYLRNKVTRATIPNVIDNATKVLEIKDGKVEFPL